MGHMVESVLKERGHEVLVLGRNPEKPDVDVIIEFTTPASVLDNIKLASSWQIPMVTGTTGWHDQLSEVRDLVSSGGSALFYASNFSIGVYLYNAVNEYMAKLMNAHDDYDVSMEEIHHTGKLDSPSGTAISIAEKLIENVDRKTAWKNESSVDETVLEIISKREENVPGTHSVTYDSDIDTLTFSHVAKGRRGFALGAVLAAEWLSDKTGLFGMSDMLKIN
jgi:4-hydroxy-tetrahydrodipicolinate reductase